MGTNQDNAVAKEVGEINAGTICELCEEAPAVYIVRVTAMDDSLLDSVAGCKDCLAEALNSAVLTP